MTARAATRGAASGSRTSRRRILPPRRSGRTCTAGRRGRTPRDRRADTPGRAGSPSRPAPAGAGGAPATRPVRPVGERLHGRGHDGPAAVGLVVGVRPHAVPDTGAEVGGVGAVGEVDNGPPPRSSTPTRGSARRRSAASRPPRGARGILRTWTSSQSPAWRPVRTIPRSWSLRAKPSQNWRHSPTLRS